MLIVEEGPTKVKDEVNRMGLSREVVNELLLVCSVITSTGDDGDEVVPVTDCVNWLQDLQRVLRRDDDTFRPISLKVGSWKIAEQKLIPLALQCQYDSGMLLTILKILVILTKPMSPTAKRHIRGSDIKGNNDLVIDEQTKMYRNALAQNEQLMEYKRVICQNEDGLISILGGLLAEPLSRKGIRRTDSDHMTIELILHLFRNLLSAQPVLKKDVRTSYEATELHHKLVCIFEKNLVLDLVLVLSEQLEAVENAHYNLLILEILHYLLKNQDPTIVAQSGMAAPPKVKNSLKSALMTEKQNLSHKSTSRHSHFGGTFVYRRPDGSRKVVSALQLDQPNISRTKPSRRRPNNQPFVGSKLHGTADSTRSKLEQSYHSPIKKKSHAILCKFCKAFLPNAYGCFAKSLKNELRRDSARLEESDTLFYFQINSFFFQWLRKYNDHTISTISSLCFSMDVFSFTTLYTTMERLYARKLYHNLEPAVALYKEMMIALFLMRTEDTDETEKVMAMGLMDALFYAKEPIDKCQKLISWWKPGSFTRSYMCDLVEVVHYILKLLLLDANDKCKNEGDFKEKQGITARFKVAAYDFDFNRYLYRLVSSHLVRMYTDLLSEYQLNTIHINHHIIAFFTKMYKVSLSAYGYSSESEDDAQKVIREELNLQQVTLEPMLYNIHTFSTINTILQQAKNNYEIAKDKCNESVFNFAVSYMQRFSKAAKKNPMIFTEILFKSANPSKYCNSLSNTYITEEMVMMVERDMLLRAIDDVADEEELVGEPPKEKQNDRKVQLLEGINENDDSSEEETTPVVEKSVSFQKEKYSKKRVSDTMSSAQGSKSDLKRLKRGQVLAESSDEEVEF